MPRTRTTSKRPLTAKQVGIKYGFRSGLEEQVAAELKRDGVAFEYEPERLPYTVPARQATYTFDFRLPNGIIVETKGRFVTADRQKMVLIKQQHPELDIRLLFNNPDARISKQSRTTYAMWCEKYGFPYAKAATKAKSRDGAASIPKEWLK